MANSIFFHYNHSLGQLRTNARTHVNLFQMRLRQILLKCVTKLLLELI